MITSFWYGLRSTMPDEYQRVVAENEKNYGVTLIEFPEQRHQYSARHSSDRQRFAMAIDNPRLRYLDCDTVMTAEWPVLPNNGVPYFANHYGCPETWAIDFNGVGEQWIETILNEWTNQKEFLAHILDRHWGEWKFLPQFTKHKPWSAK